LGELTALPEIPYLDLRWPTSKKREGMGRKGNEGERNDGKRTKGDGRRWEGRGGQRRGGNVEFRSLL